MLFKIVFICFVVTIQKIQAEDLSQGAEGTNVELTKGYQFSTLIDSNGKPAGQAYAYLGGKLTQVPSPTYYSEVSGCTSSSCPGYAVSPVSSGLWLGNVTAVTYFVAGVVAALSLWYVCSILIVPASKKSSLTDLDDDEKSTVGGVPAKELSEKAKSRRRRAIRKADAEMTRLAEIVLASVESGECLQKSICLLGSQMSARKGKLADSLLSTLLPTRIQQSDYYIVLKKSLRGELSCDKFGCPH